MGLFSKIRDKFVKNDKGEEVKKYDDGLKKTRGEFISSLNNLSKKYKFINEDYFSDLEDILIMADIGVSSVMKFVDSLRDRVKKENITSSLDLKEVIVDELFMMYVSNDILSSKINFSDGKITTILFVGVNGVGKTTTIGKIAHKYKQLGHKVMLIAGDTFRAGAVEQIEEWGKRVEVPVISSLNKDPSSVIFDGLSKAKEEEYDLVLIDTAGRLQNKVNLMQELSKINKVIDKVCPDDIHETLLVVDATTGQNGISQAKSFKEITDITGIVLTKLDGTAKGGIVLGIKEEIGIPVKFVGLGEGMDDLEVFDPEKYIYGLFKDL